MKRHNLIAAALLSAGLGFATTAAADCADGTRHAGGCVEGRHRRRPSPKRATPQTGGMAAAPDDAMAKDAGKAGNLMPMGESADVATSAEDAAAQSAGGETAAAQAAGAEGGGDGGKQAAINEARAALAAGDEAACMAAVEKAKAM